MSFSKEDLLSLTKSVDSCLARLGEKLSRFESSKHHKRFFPCHSIPDNLRQLETLTDSVSSSRHQISYLRESASIRRSISNVSCNTGADQLTPSLEDDHVDRSSTKVDVGRRNGMRQIEAALEERTAEVARLKRKLLQNQSDDVPPLPDFHRH